MVLVTVRNSVVVIVRVTRKVVVAALGGKQSAMCMVVESLEECIHKLCGHNGYTYVPVVVVAPELIVASVDTKRVMKTVLAGGVT